MAGLKLKITSGEVATVNGVKTLLQIKAAANQRVVIRGIRIFGKDLTTTTNAPVKIRMTRSTSAFGSSASSVGVIAKNDPSDAETIQTTVTSNFNSEPTSPTDAGLWWELQPQTLLEEFYGPGEEIKIPGGQSLQFEVTAGAVSTMVISVDAEE